MSTEAELISSFLDNSLVGPVLSGDPKCYNDMDVRTLPSTDEHLTPILHQEALNFNAFTLAPPLDPLSSDTLEVFGGTQIFLSSPISENSFENNQSYSLVHSDSDHLNTVNPRQLSSHDCLSFKELDFDHFENENDSILNSAASSAFEFPLHAGYDWRTNDEINAAIEELRTREKLLAKKRKTMADLRARAKAKAEEEKEMELQLQAIEKAKAEELAKEEAISKELAEAKEKEIAEAEILQIMKISTIPASRHSSNGKGRSGSRKYKRRRDLDSDKERPFKCNDCDKYFRRQEHLKRHIRSLHTTYRPYVCQWCTKRFSRTDNLTQHKKAHHSSLL